MTDSQVYESLISRNPASGQELGRYPVSPPEAVSELVARASIAQRKWADLPWKSRQATLKRWWALLARDVDDRDLRQARSVAGRLEVGTVAINEAVTTSAHAAAPFGGCKSSGHGRIRGVVGLRELAQTRVIHTRNPGGFRPHLFPYGPSMLKIFASYRRIFHPKG